MTRSALLAVIALLFLASPAAAEGPVATARPTAQLTVSFRAAAESSSFHWDFGDGTTGEGAVAEHVYAQPGR